MSEFQIIRFSVGSRSAGIIAEIAGRITARDGKTEGKKTDGWGYYLEVPSGKSVTITYTKNAGGEVAGLIHRGEAQGKMHRAGNRHSENKDQLDGASVTLGPGDYWLTCWFKQPGWEASKPWQQQPMKLITPKDASKVLLGCEDHWGNPGTSGSIDWNDLEISFSKP